jgi:hypothetical protein
MASSDPLLLSRRGLRVRVVGVGLVGFVMAGHHDRRAHRAHVTHAVGERKSLLSHTLSAWFALPKWHLADVGMSGVSALPLPAKSSHRQSVFIDSFVGHFSWSVDRQSK